MLHPLAAFQVLCDRGLVYVGTLNMDIESYPETKDQEPVYVINHRWTSGDLAKAGRRLRDRSDGLDLPCATNLMFMDYSLDGLFEDYWLFGGFSG